MRARQPETHPTARERMSNEGQMATREWAIQQAIAWLEIGSETGATIAREYRLLASMLPAGESESQAPKGDKSSAPGAQIPPGIGDA